MNHSAWRRRLAIILDRTPSRAIMAVLGHSGISVTINTDVHVLPALRQEAADAIDEVFEA